MLDTKYTRQQHAKNTSLEYLSEYFSLKSAENKNIQSGHRKNIHSDEEKSVFFLERQIEKTVLKTAWQHKAVDMNEQNMSFLSWNITLRDTKIANSILRALFWKNASFNDVKKDK